MNPAQRSQAQRNQAQVKVAVISAQASASEAQEMQFLIACALMMSLMSLSTWVAF